MRVRCRLLQEAKRVPIAGLTLRETTTTEYRTQVPVPTISHLQLILNGHERAILGPAQVHTKGTQVSASQGGGQKHIAIGLLD